VSSIQPATLSPPRYVPATIPRPEYVGRPAPTPSAGSHVQTAETIEKMRAAGRLAAQAMAAAGAAVAPGLTTDELDAIVHRFLTERGAYPSTLSYRGFPKSCCTSVNEVICHGIPDVRPLRDGDLVKIDVTAYLDGVHGDNCATYLCGEVDQASRLLVERTRQALDRAVRAVRPGRRVNVVGRVIESYARRFGYGVVADYTGHGVHSTFHSGLVIPHIDDPNHDTVIEAGMTFTIEPMITLGNPESVIWDDGWTVLTADGSRCAQFEHTVAVTDSGAEILTLP
jgi:methionyl aminopeptidase